MSEEKENRAKTQEEEILEGEVVDEGEDTTDIATVPVSEYDRVVQELQQLKEQAKSNFDGWQRERADFANYKRRVEREQQAATQNITAEVIKKYLTVLDDLERALKARPTEGSAEPWSNGIELIFRKLQNILEAEGVQRIPAENEEFNPSRHEAISYEESSDHEGGQIIEVVQQGYTIGDRVIRPAMVRVARG